MTSFTNEEIARVVRQILWSADGPLEPREASYPSVVGASAVHAARCQRPAPPVHEIDDPRMPGVIAQLVGATSSQIAVGHRGLRFKTDLYLRMREGHADAKDAVHSEVPPEWATAHKLRPLKSRCDDRTEYLLYPNHGRRLDDASKIAIADVNGSRPDVQVIVGDGLSPNAVLKNGPDALAALIPALGSAGFRVGPGLYVKFARIGIADEIGVLMQARATIIIVGERPGLGTGDSLSFYIAVNPKLDQDNAEKNCISNVRPIGIMPERSGADRGRHLEARLRAGWWRRRHRFWIWSHMSTLQRTPAIIKALRVLPAAAAELRKSLSVPDNLPSIALITCDQDDPLYAALDHATKMAEVEVTFAKSFYAGSKHASGPWSGEIMGVLAARDPEIIAAGVRAVRVALDELYAFYAVGDTGVSVFPTVISSCGR